MDTTQEGREQNVRSSHKGKLIFCLVYLPLSSPEDGNAPEVSIPRTARIYLGKTLDQTL